VFHQFAVDELYDILEEFRSKLVAALVNHTLLQIKT
jgi:hypothetical protein